MGAHSEHALGITEYVTHHTGFHATIKTLFSDFVVHEVDSSGQVLSLRQELEHAPQASAFPDSDARGRTVTAELPLDALRECFGAVFDAGETERILEFVQNHWNPASAPATAGATILTLTVCPDKDRRRARHTALRVLAPRFASVTNSSNQIQVYPTDEDGRALLGSDPDSIQESAARLRAAKRRRACDRRERCARHGGSYLRFLLCKQNLDTNEVVMRLARSLGLKPNAFTYAGTKDRRGVTTQEMRIWQCTPARLEKAVERAFGQVDADSGAPQIRVGGFRCTKEPLRLGQLQGNYFRLVLRSLAPNALEEVDSAIVSLREHGFINYFGLQRFGSGRVPTHHIGLALLRGKWREALDLILTASLVETRDEQQSLRVGYVRPILEAYLRERDAARALTQLAALPRAVQRGLHLEKRLLQAECQYGARDLPAIFHSLPRNLRTLYLHAVQSYVWNEMASERIRAFGAKELHPGDLVLEPVPAGAPSAHTIADADTIVDDDHDHDGDVDDDAPSAPATDTVTDPESAAPSLTHADNAGTASKATVDATASGFAPVSVHPVTQADIDSQRYTIFDLVVPVPGLQTEAISCPAAARAYRRFVETYGVSLMGTDAPALCKQYTMRGTYRRVLVRPERLTYRFVRHESPREPLLDTDLSGLPARDAQSIMNVNDAPVESRFLSCVLCFQLPASSYATMLLRELTKNQTDRTTQTRFMEEQAADHADTAAATTTSVEAGAPSLHS
jgi:tRNA pseudouridine13 synthase